MEPRNSGPDIEIFPNLAFGCPNSSFHPPLEVRWWRGYREVKAVRLG
jgi:hypothetical protein